MKKLFALLMVLVMTVAMFTACQSADKPNETPNAGENNNAAGVIKIGTSGPLNNDYAV